MSSLKAFRIIRITRILKTVQLVRVLRFVVALRTLVTSIFHTLKSLVWALAPSLFLHYKEITYVWSYIWSYILKFVHISTSLKRFASRSALGVDVKLPKATVSSRHEVLLGLIVYVFAAGSLKTVSKG